jgi:hypothetical protein
VIGTEDVVKCGSYGFSGVTPIEKSIKAATISANKMIVDLPTDNHLSI